MSVRKWKQVITLSVITIILLLTITTVVLGIKLNKSVNSNSDYNLELVSKKEGNSIEYQNKYPDLYVENDFLFDNNTEKTCYLTFDDGPNVSNTNMILDVLKEYNAKATFFVIYKEGAEEEALYKRIVNEGHTIAIHTASHNYYEIYSSVDAYLEDFNKISTHIESITGVKPEIFRFPGGSLNSYNMGIYQELICEMTRRGYVYYDWSHSSGDAAGSNVPTDVIVNNSISGNDEQKILLMHDGAGHGNTAAALPYIIQNLLEQGYSLKSLNNNVRPVSFGYL